MKNYNVKTEGIKYNGSKLKIIPQILNLIDDLDGIKDIMDGFSGTTRVSQALAKNGYNVTALDISNWSEVFGICYLKSDKNDSYYKTILNELNSLKGYKGWFSENYGSNDLSKVKSPFQIQNTMRLDAIRDRIDELNLDNNDKSVLLTSLILALDSVDNTMGHYVSYLSKWSPRSYNKLEMKLPLRFNSTGNHHVIRGDIFDFTSKPYDLVYLDPPYGSNNDKMPSSRVRYNSYYHIWKTVILNDTPELFGKANRREDSRDFIKPSIFEEFRKNDNGDYIAMTALRELIAKINSKYIILSYSSGGRSAKQDIINTLNDAGKIIKIIDIDYPSNVMGGMRWTNEWINDDSNHQEFLFLLEKSNSYIQY